MYVILTLILATLAVWVIIYNILVFWISKNKEHKERVVSPGIDESQNFVIKQVDKIEETEVPDSSEELLEMEEEPEPLGEQIDLSKEELEQVVKDKDLTDFPVILKGGEKLIEEKLVPEDAQKLIIEKLELKIKEFVNCKNKLHIFPNQTE